VLWTSIPLVPVMVRFLVPVGVDEFVHTVRVEDPGSAYRCRIKAARGVRRQPAHT
jgi:hypothetical protein